MWQEGSSIEKFITVHFLKMMAIYPDQTAA